ncbi:MAG: MlaE family lipid ABC transporter permease subunit [Synechococcales cyanobacterium C42_A2020_086]|nr:MlaE family lipid ABC transporter permease subunit [Synechococcales cyanobacterium M58_A2018_015]MBF2072586.1 MlaE family lipid ABC transporter permease subunit [Synechococcales cyanobacterium C42_A2020_086]
MNKSVQKSPFRAWSQRALAAALLGGQVIVHLLRGNIHRRNTLEQLTVVGPDSLPIILLTATTIGMVFTVEVAAEFLRFGVGSAVGGVLAIALGRELAPLVTAVVLAGRVGSAFAAELGTMQVTEQIDALYMLKTDPIDYLVTPRVIACCVMTPVLTILSFVTGMFGGMLLADWLFNISNAVFLDSARSLLTLRDLICGMIKGAVFGWLIAVIGSSWGLTTKGGAKGVGQSTTTAVVTSLLMIFISNFFLSWLMFSALK